jgi:hypothetical protein
MSVNLIILFNFLGYRPINLGLISVRINYNNMLFLGCIKEGLLSISIHPTMFIYYMRAI